MSRSNKDFLYDQLNINVVFNLSILMESTRMILLSDDGDVG
jgi:hypothetical protein